MTGSIIEEPTYMRDVRHFFADVDLDHMFGLGIDITTYDALKAESTDVYVHTLGPNAHMPPEPDRKWSAERSQSFFNWISKGHPLGVPEVQSLATSAASRIRKDARDLSADELQALRNAFSGVMALEPDDPNSYFTLAGLHWFPVPSECKHHEDKYNPWHRVFMNRFEDALRSVPGCETVTLPYWDITAAPPNFLYEPPFDSYTLPLDVHALYPAGYATSRFDAATVMENVASYGIPEDITTSLAEFRWSRFTTGIEGAHDEGHVSIGPTMSRPDVAAFDPLFWFFHSNWERLWWNWQQAMQATTEWSFRSTIDTSTLFLTPPFNALEPFSQTAEQAINLAAMDVGYAEPQGPDKGPVVPETLEPPTRGSLIASSTMRATRRRVSARVKGVDRLAIPGSFRVMLRADGEPVGRRAFFQSTQPKDCENCRQRPRADFDFVVDLEDVSDRSLSVDVELLSRDDPREGMTVPLRACGNPTLNVRVLLEEMS